MNELGLYVHIPFCAARCPYCDFATAPATSALRARYLDALGRELAREGSALGRPYVRTLYVGGGTPSLLEPGEIRALAAAIRASFAFAPLEATVEANPATLDRARLRAWRELGMTRLSLGAQSFEPAGLRALGRTHQPSDVAPAVAAARAEGMDVSLDLIFGWPGQTEAHWSADLGAALALDPDHLSLYPLELRLDDPEEAVANWPGGGWPVLERWRSAAAAAQPDDDAIARRYELAERLLARAGFRHYEIANWARPTKRSLHNLGYWRDEEWLGVGAGAHSHLAGVRSRNPASLLEYIARIDAASGRLADGEADAAVDGAMLALRLDEGLDLVRYAGRFGIGARDRVIAALRSLDDARLLRWSYDSPGGTRDSPGGTPPPSGGIPTAVRLTPRGRLLASEVFVRLLPD